MDLYGKDKGNVSLPPRLQSPDSKKGKLKEIIINTQKAFYDLKIAETIKKVQRITSLKERIMQQIPGYNELEERNKELEDTLKDTDSSIQVLQEERSQEISGLKLQVTAQVAKMEEYKQRVSALENTRRDHKSSHTEKLININEKYDNTRLKLISQLKLLNAKTNVLEDYKSMQQILEKKLDTQNKALSHDNERVSEKLRQIERKFETDKKKLIEELYNRLLDLAGAFQLEVAQHMPYSMSRLLSENIAVSNMLSAIAESTSLKKRDNIEHKNAVTEYKKRINDEHLSTKRSLLVAKLEKFASAKLDEMRDKVEINLSKISKFNYLTEEQYAMNIDNAKNRARQCDMRVKYLEILLYCEKEKLTIAKGKKQQLIDQLQKHTQMLYDIKCTLKHLENV